MIGEESLVLTQEHEVTRIPLDGRPGREKLRPDNPKIAAAALAGWFVGVLPYLVFATRRSPYGVWPAVVFVVLAFLVTIKSLKPDATDATEPPNSGEWLLASYSSVMEGATVTFGALLFFGVGYWGARLWNYLVVGLMELRAAADPQRIAFWTSLAFAAFIGLAAASTTVEKVRRTLYPATAGTRSIYYSLLRQKLKLYLFAAAVVAGVTLVLIEPGSWRATIIAASILFYVAMPLDELEKGPRPRAGGLIDEVVKVLESAGYAIVRSPRTGDPMIDPLIQNVTLLASEGDDGFAIEVTHRDPDAPVPWSAASAVRTAAAVLQQQMVIDGRHLQSVQPVLILSGGAVSPGLQRFSETEGVRLIHLLGTDGADEGGRLAESLGAIGIRVPAGGGEVHA